MARAPDSPAGVAPEIIPAAQPDRYYEVNAWSSLSRSRAALENELRAGRPSIGIRAKREGCDPPNAIQLAGDDRYNLFWNNTLCQPVLSRRTVSIRKRTLSV
jgi:hypothetical protein